ncbi:hypothetical protein [Streptomyces erythrochromogenes]|uniref:hypothetical protein n=1 Tax=Streptomyces erythrochromogenes TaxID=285574 RepID=UPI003702753C
MASPFLTLMPLRWLGPLTGDAARVATQIIDRGHKGLGCFATDQTIASALGLHRSTVQDAMRLLEGLEDGRAMRVETSNRSTITRRLRPLHRAEDGTPVEPYLRIVNFARNNLQGNRFSVYAYASYCADLSQALKVSCTSPRLGCCAVHACGLGEDTVRKHLKSLVADRWLTLTQQGGGRRKGSFYEVHERPAPVENPLDLATANPLDLATSNPPDLATQNTQLLTGSSEQAREVSCGSAGTALQVVARGPVENPAAEAFPQAVADPVAASPEPQQEPSTTISATAYRVLRLLPLELSPGQYGLAAKAIEQAVAQVGGDVDRISDRVHRHFAGQHIADPYGWLIHRGLRNSPCPAPECEDGRTWPTGADCPICRERYADRRGTPLVFRGRATAIYKVTWTCTRCERPGPGEVPPDGVCDRCCPDSVAPAPFLAADVQDRAAAVRAQFRHKAAAEPEHAAQVVAREQKRARRRELDEQRRAGKLR